MQVVAWILFALTSLSMLARKEGVVFGFLFFLSALVGFFTFGLLKGLGYLALLIVSAVVFHIIERLLSMSIVAGEVKDELKRKWDKQDKNKY